MSTAAPGVLLCGQALVHAPLSSGDGAVAGWMREAGAAIANFEGTVAAAGAWPTKTRTVHAADAALLASLRSLGLTHLAHANNHAYDLGPAGIAATHEAAASAGLAIAGSGASIDEAARAAVTVTPSGRVALIACDLGPQPDIVYAAEARPGINPLRVATRVILPRGDVERLAAIAEQAGYSRRIASRVKAGHRAAPPEGVVDFFGLPVAAGAAAGEAHEPSQEDLARVEAAIAAARGKSDIVVVSLHNHHWEDDWAATPAWLEPLARRLVDAGADAILGHGAPVLQGMEIYRGKPILYGLGNLVFHTRRASRYTEHGFDVWRSMAVLCRFAPGGKLARITARPVRVSRLPDAGGAQAQAPSFLRGKERDAVIESFVARSELAGARCERSEDGLEILPD